MFKKLEKFDKRTFQVLLSAGISAGARLTGFIFTLYVTPKIYRFFGQEEFGLWSIIVQLITLAAFADFGLGNGLLTRLAQKQEPRDTETYIASAFFLLCGASATLFVLAETALFAYGRFATQWGATPLNETSRTLLHIFFVIFCATLPFSITQKVQFANLHNSRYHSWEIVDKSLGIIAVLVAIAFGAALPVVFAAFYLPTLLATVANFLSYNRGELPRTALNVRNIERAKTLDLFAIGRAFFFTTLAFNLTRGTDGILLAYISDLGTVAHYQLPLRLYDLILVVVMLFTSPLWSGYANAFANNDLGWVKQNLLRSLLGASLLALVVGGALAVLGNRAVSVWVRTAVDIPHAVYFALFVWTFVNTLVNVLSAYLNARAKINQQLYMFLAFGAVGVPLKIAGFHLGGLSGFVMANSLSLLSCVLLPSLVMVYRDFHRVQKEGLR